MRNLAIIPVLVFGLSGAVWAQDQGHGEQADSTRHEAHISCHEEEQKGYDATNTAYHHISDANVFMIGPFNLPLPCILYVPGEGFDVFMSSKFDIGHHGTGHYAYKDYVLDGGIVRRIVEADRFPDGKVELDCIAHVREGGALVAYAIYQGEAYRTDYKSTADAGLFGGGITSFYDFSLTKNVITMLLVFILAAWMFIAIARSYKERKGKAPKGMQSFIEPIFVFIRDEVAIPFLGNAYMRYLPFLMSIFFFILFLNLIGQIPMVGNPNVTGNLAVTLVLAVFAFFVTNLSGKKAYWQHIFWMPGVPAWVKIILTPVEVLGLFIKPFTLMLRLFANITAGHIVVLSFVGLIFIFGNAGESLFGSSAGAVISIPLTIFMMAIELLVAFIQAFVFVILTASYIGAAIEEHH